MLVGAALDAELDLAVVDLVFGDLGALLGDENLADGPVGIGEVRLRLAFGADAHAGADHVDLLGEQGGDDAVPVHRLVFHGKAHLLGDPVHGVDVEPGGLAGFVHVGERRIVGVDAVDEVLAGGQGGGGKSDGEQQSSEPTKSNPFHFFLTEGWAWSNLHLKPDRKTQDDSGSGRSGSPADSKPFS